MKNSEKNIAQNSKLIEIGNFKQTMDYMKYEIIKGTNRPIDEKHIQLLIESFKDYGSVSSTVIILETSAFGGLKQIKADGQHRCIVANRLNMPLNVQVVKLTNDTKVNVIKYIASLNNYLKTWRNEIYLEIYANADILEYQKLRELTKLTGLTVTDFLYIFRGNGGQKESKNFKNGDFKFIDEIDSTKLLDAVVSLSGHVPNKSYVRRGLYFAMKMTKGEYQRLANAIIKVCIEKEKYGLSFSENETHIKNEMVLICKKEFNID